VSQAARPDGSRLETISASEVGRYVYCARAWWLERVMGLAPGNSAALKRGVRGHEAHGAAVSAARYQTLLALLFLAVSAVIGVVLFFSFWTR
jgi:CRISPR/Cas system-associated exonuclease Cas4 (RecB family)